MSKSCKTCKFAEWERTSTGRITKNAGSPGPGGKSGTCTFDVLPIFGEYFNKLPSSHRRDARKTYKHGLWNGDGHDCPCWQEGGKR